MSEQEQFIVPSATAAQAESDRRRGPNLRLKPGRQYNFRLLPAFKILNGDGIWFGIARKHWKIPVDNTVDESRTFACPQERGEECYICGLREEFSSAMPALAKKLTPNTNYMFNIIDVDNPQFGIQQLEDGATLFNLFTGIIQANPTIADPIQGGVIQVTKLTQTPWRTAVPTGRVVSLDELGIGVDAALPSKLKNLDDAFTYIAADEQRQLFSQIATNPQGAFNDTPGGVVVQPVAQPVGAAAVAVPAAVIAPVAVAAAQPVGQPAPTTAPAPVAPAAAFEPPAQGSDEAKMQADLEAAVESAG